MADLTLVAADVRPLSGAIIRGGYLGEAASVGDLVSPKSDGLFWKSSASATPVLPAVGVVVAIGTEGATSGAAGDRVSVQFGGPIAGFTVASAAKAFTSNNAGKIADAAGTTSQVVGVGLSDNVLWLEVNLV